MGKMNQKRPLTIINLIIKKPMMASSKIIFKINKLKNKKTKEFRNKVHQLYRILSKIVT